MYWRCWLGCCIGAPPRRLVKLLRPFAGRRRSALQKRVEVDHNAGCYQRASEAQEGNEGQGMNEEKRNELDDQACADQDSRPPYAPFDPGPGHAIGRLSRR